MSLIARELEAAGIATVILGSALDIVERCGVPRFVFTDFPLGNPCGRPWDEVMQADIVRTALDVLEQSTHPRTTVRTGHRWPTNRWRTRFMEVRDDNRQMLLDKGKARRAEQDSRDGG